MNGDTITVLLFHIFLLRVYEIIQKFKDQDIQSYNFACFLYGCETWSLTLREEHKLRVFENRVLRRIFGPKRDGVTGEWRKLYNDELNLMICTAHPILCR